MKFCYPQAMPVTVFGNVLTYRRVSYLCLRSVSEVRHRGGNRWLPKGMSMGVSMAGFGAQ